MRRAEGSAKFFGVFRVKNHDFTPKNHIFSNFRRGARRVRIPPGSAPGNKGRDGSTSPTTFDWHRAGSVTTSKHEGAPLSDNPRRTEQLCVFGPREPSPVHGRGDKHNTMLSIPVYLSVSTVINYTWCGLVKTFLSVSTCILLQLACYCENKIVNVTNTIVLCFIMMYHIIAVYGVTKNRKKFRRACYIAEVSCFRTEWVSPLTAIVKISLLFPWKTSGLYT